MSSADSITLPDRFRLDREIGRGGMAVVYRAHDRHLDREVAIKVLSEDLSSTVSAERFQREIALMARLVHPGIVALFDSGESEGRLFYVMPFVAGNTLRARLDREKKMTMEDVAAYGADVADALAYAHGLGIVHRDIKPENIFAVGGRALLADFGIARIVDYMDAATDLTTGGMIVGTTAYMSPEQALGEKVIDGRSDLYSLGCVLYELLTGAPPFTGATAMAVLSMHITQSPRRLREQNVRVSQAMEAIVMQLLEKDPTARPASAGSVASELRGALALREDRASVRSPPSSGPSRVNDLVDKGMSAWRRGLSGGAGSRLTLEEAGAYFERALAIEPNNVRALCGMSNWHMVMIVRGFSDAEKSFAKSRDLLFAALAADDQYAGVHSALGVLALYFDDDFHGAARHSQIALELDPNEPEALRFQGVVYKILGRIDEAVVAARASAERAPDAAFTWNGLGDVLIAAGRNAEAVDALKHAINLRPGYGPALERLELAQARSGDTDHAMETRESRLRIAGHADRADAFVRNAEMLGYTEARRRDVQTELDELLRVAETVNPFAEYFTSRTPADRIVIAYTELNEWHKAMDWVERAYERYPGRLRRLLTDQPFDRRGLAVDPRYARLLRVAGLEELL